MKWYRGGIAHCNGRKPGVACNKHQGRELKTSTIISFQNPLLHNMHQTTTSNKTKQGFLPEMAPVNIRKHDRLHGAKPSLNISPPFFPLIQNLRQTTKYKEWVHNGWSQGARSTHGGCPPQACSKQTCTKRARLQSDCRKKQLTIDP